MRTSGRILFSIVLQAVFLVSIKAQTGGPLLLQTPTVSRTQVAFVYAEDIWVVERQGGEARRLTTNPARERNPVFSPDGSLIAFARFNPAGGPFSWDVYVVPASGGEERRLTYHPDLDFPINWTPDGKNVLVLSFRNRTSILGGGLYTVPAKGGFPAEVPLPRGWTGSFSPAGDRLAYTPLVNPLDVFAWRNYRGGGTSKIRLSRLADGQTETIPRENSNDTDPMWVGDKVYFVSDRDGTENLFVYDTRKRVVSQLTRFEKYGVRFASAGGGAIVFAQGGALHLFDTTTNQSSKLDVRVSGDFAEVKPRKIDAAQWLGTVTLAPDAARLLFGIRGEIFSINPANGEALNLTETPAAAERNPVWSPDGKWIAYFSDESGEQELHLREAQATGGAGKAVRRISIESKPSIYSELQWSPDSRKLAFTDAHLALWYFDLERNAAHRVDVATHTDGDASLQPVWSPDSLWLAYSKYGINRVRLITLYSLQSGKFYPVTDARMDAQAPAFDSSGKYLYFIGSNRTGLVESQGMSGFPFRTQVTRSLYAVVLNRNDPSPFAAQSGAQTKTATDGRAAIDLEKIGERVLLMPNGPQNPSRLMAGKPGVLFIVEGGTLHRFVSGKPGVEKFVEGAGLYRVTSDGSRLLLRRQGNWALVSTTAPPKPEDGRFKVNPIEFVLDPRAEWRQMYAEAWRRMREYFYDRNLHGQNPAALKEHYAAYLPGIAAREDLNALFKEMFSHLSTSHMGIVGGDHVGEQGARQETTGLLGADFEIAEGRYRIKRILTGDNARGIASPLAEPGVNARAGEYLLAVDGEEIEASENLYRYFLNKASRAVQIKVGPKSDGSGARMISVVPIISEYQLRQHDWVESNRRRVEEASHGKLGYIYLINTADEGYNTFNREFYAQLDKQGLIVDGRFNEGGRAADYIIDTLRRVPLQRAALRDGGDITIPTGIINGPKVLLTNEMAGSGGDSLPWMWQQTKLGPVVGARTGGAGVGASTHQLLDGGSIRVPDWGWYDPLKGTWLMENRGVTPDYEVEVMPVDWRAGRDPQLEKAIQLALDALKKSAPPMPKRPAYPVYK
ncbi:MAG TPA: PDZ domain-containing protein [Pyrinomonadaceae bacterium]|nr:PDZ domain-containing protein [Pyrinomonadaceae bacterium]